MEEKIGDTQRAQKGKKQLLHNLFTNLLGPIIVGIVVLLGQAIVQPWAAGGVKKEETVLEQRYTACSDAFDILLRKLERASIRKGEIRYEPVPTQEKLTAIEVNKIYSRLVLYCSGNSVPRQFADLLKAEHLRISDIGSFVLNLRREMGIEGEAVEPNDFNFAYPTEKVLQ